MKACTAQSFLTWLTFVFSLVTGLKVVGGPAKREAIGRAKRVFTAAAAAASPPVVASSPPHRCQIQPHCGSLCCLKFRPVVAVCPRLFHRGKAADHLRYSGAKRSSSCQQSTRGAPEQSEQRGGWDRYATTNTPRLLWQARWNMSFSPKMSTLTCDGSVRWGLTRLSPQ